MQQPKRVLCIMDMAGVGRSSMAVVLPVLAACGVQACPLPTALFSTHTGGFGSVQLQDTTRYGEGALAHYQEQNISFDAVYTGYLQGAHQFALAMAAQRQYPHALRVVDPAMGDHGKRYSKITPSMVESMGQLCRHANLITPNYTETALLLGQPPCLTPPSPEEMQDRLRQLSSAGAAVVATSVPLAGGGLVVAGCGAAGTHPYTLPVQLVPQNYPGTGDLFAAALVGLMLRGLAAQEAATLAGAFVEAAIQATFAAGGEAKQGVWFEPQLYRLTSYLGGR